MDIKGIPFDAPLYEFDPERGVEYWNSEGVFAAFTIAADVRGLLPEGLAPAGDRALGSVWVADYPTSTLGPYREFISLIQVMDPGGETGWFIPYIYVTSDAALAAGREVVGAPKKLARIELVKEGEVLQGILERPAGKRLATLTMRPAVRAQSEAVRALAPPRTPLYSVRHLPPIDGKGGVTQLVKWFAEIRFHTDTSGQEILFTGPASLTYDSPSAIDPVHNLPVGDLVAVVYAQFDMTLGVSQILSEW